MQRFGGRVRFVEENYGESELARRLGVTRYPAVFVNDVLVATPNDFGFYGPDDTHEGGRYAPIKSAQGQDKFRADLERMLTLTLDGDTRAARAIAAPAADAAVTQLPSLHVNTLAGQSLALASLRDRVVVVEFWATWCPPCRGTLRWLGELRARYGDKLAVVAFAVESPEPAVKKLTDELGIPVTWVIATPQSARAFGDVSAVPTLHLFGPGGAHAGSFYGATPDLHQRVEARIATLVR